MAEKVVNQYRSALEVISVPDLNKVDQVLDEGYLVNALEVEIDSTCVDILVRRQPAANDLRLVMTLIKIINELERIGDEAENIARAVKQITQSECIHTPPDITTFYTTYNSLEMVECAHQALRSMDMTIAKQLLHKEFLQDEEARIICRHLVAYLMEDTSEMIVALEISLISRSIQNVSAHAKNIALHLIHFLERQPL